MPILRCFDHAPAFGKIAVVLRQSPNSMKMVRQQNPGINSERKTGLRLQDSNPQKLTGIGMGENRLPMLGDQGEKITAPGGSRPAIVGHTHPLNYGGLTSPSIPPPHFNHSSHKTSRRVGIAPDCRKMWAVPILQCFPAAMPAIKTGELEKPLP